MFDPAGYYIKTLHAGHDELTSPDGLGVLDGVPAGDYTVVSYANVKRSVIASLIPGVSTAAELYVALGNGAVYRTGDPLFHSLKRFTVRRGEPVVTPVALNKLFYRIELNVTGAEKVEDFRITFSGAPSGIDYAGHPFTGPVIYQPTLQTAEAGEQSGSLCIPRFTDGASVMMTLASGERLLAQMSLSEYLKQGDVAIDLTAKDVVIPIDVAVSTAEITVTVNDWNDGAVQIPMVGH